MSSELEALRRERDLYLRLLQLGRQADPTSFLKEALGLIVELTDAKQGYLELTADDDTAQPRWWIAHGFSAPEVADVRAALSRGIIAEAVARGETIVTPSAREDPRFQDRDSVIAARIEAVLCTPVGQDPPRGVLYLQGETRVLFAPAMRTLAELFAEHLAPLADSLAVRSRVESRDPTQSFRAQLRVDGIVGRSETLAATLKQLALVAPLDVCVLLTGDTGTGKSQLARAIHENGLRASQPFIEVNCAALPDTLVESELFGAMPGAHSTATRRIEGKVTAAEHGTLFLDEIGELSPPVQAKLLQLLQSRQYYPLGAAKPLQADVRVITATNIDLKAAVADKRFREDLFYRLQVLPIRVPALAERRADIAELALSFCAQTCERYSFPKVGLSRNTLRALEHSEWPGNIRQLANMVEAGVIRCVGESASQVEVTHVFQGAAASSAAAAPPPERQTLQEATRDFQSAFLRDALEANDWNVLETSRQLDVARSHLYSLIRAFGLERSAKE